MSTVERLKTGTIDVSDIQTLEQLDVDQLISDVSVAYPARFLEHRVGDKWEVGLAKDRRQDACRRCLMLTSEHGRLTTIAVIDSIEIQPSSAATGSYEVITGGGFNLYRTPDGWKVKPMEEKSVTLTKATMQKRGWLFS